MLSVNGFTESIISTSSQTDISGVLTAACDGNNSIYYMEQGSVISVNYLPQGYSPEFCVEDERFIYVIGKNQNTL